MEALGKNILWLRKKRKLTQEELAEMLGVSAGAVSKWECGHSYPDIALLAPLARALHTTLDELLSFQKQLDRAEVQNYKRSIAVKFADQGYMACEKQIDDILKEYPSDMYLKLSMASLLYMNLIYLTCESAPIQAQKRTKLKMIIHEVMNSPQHDLYTQASYLYAILLMDEENYEEAEHVLQDMSSSCIDIQSLYLNLYVRENKEKEIQITAQRILLDGVMKVTNALSLMAQSADDEQALQFLRNCDDMFKTYRFSYRQSQRSLMQYYLQHEQYALASKAYLSYIESVIAFPFHHRDNPYLNLITLEYNEIAQQQMRRKLLETELEDAALEKLAAYPAYEKAVKLIQDYLNENDCNA